MKSRAVVSILALGLSTHVCFAEEQTVIESDNDKVSYSVGYQMGQNFQHQGVSFNLPILFRGIEDAVTESNPLMTPEQRQAALSILKKDIVLAQQQKQREKKEKNLLASKEFLETNSKKAGVVTLPSGLQYKPISSGDADGKSPEADDKVTVHYTGKLINGVEFDSSHRRNKPTTFQVNRVIKGWTEALQLMHEGDKWELYIPPDLAYGDQGAGGKIPPNSALIFEVELISVN
ncbi:MAG: FKBP-type peptidyl-prolyl cis-trans isomerase [Chromatiales bacterium]|jgi:FKBP-type peptidyl-prolyl cis-trans isomerase